MKFGISKLELSDIYAKCIISLQTKSHNSATAQVKVIKIKTFCQNLIKFDQRQPDL
jgi:hypothetical protein